MSALSDMAGRPLRVPRDTDQDVELRQRHPTGTNPVMKGDHDG